jgi:hypothetical protein
VKNEDPLESYRRKAEKARDEVTKREADELRRSVRGKKPVNKPDTQPKD